MSIEENKATQKRNTEELWIKGNLDVIDETMDENVVYGRSNIHGREEFKKALKEHLANPEIPRVEKVVYHEMIGEGDTLAVWQTNYKSDGTSIEGVTIAKFKNGKVISREWIQRVPVEEG